MVLENVDYIKCIDYLSGNTHINNICTKEQDH